MKHVVKYWILNQLSGPAPENALNIYIYIYIKQIYLYIIYIQEKLMTDIIAVTTFNKEGLDLYAQKFLDSWAKNTDDNMKLVAYAEKCEPVNPAPNKILVLDQATALPKL